MKVLMIGWELPPFHSGGLGMACYHIARHLAQKGIEVTFALPQKRDFKISEFKLLFADVSPKEGSLFPAYTCSLLKNLSNGGGDFSFGLLGQALAYAGKIAQLVKGRDFDLVHAHDWLCFPAGIAASEALGKPLVVHVHITEYDKTGGLSIDKRVFEIEKEGMIKANKVIAVSEMTKRKITNFYQIKPEKITVVHNGVEAKEWLGDYPPPAFKTKGQKIVLYVGRLTMQKGLDWLLRAAKKVLEVDPNVLFVLVGHGEMMPQLIQQAVEMGIIKNVLFTGWLIGEEWVRIFKAADLFVLPSVSDPFGIVALEAAAAGRPVLVSRQTGVSEAMNHVLRVDFWDTDEMAAKILAVLSYRPLSLCLGENGAVEAQGLNWENAAKKCLAVYHQLVA